MIVVRNVFQIKFGQAKPALAVFKEMHTLAHKIGLTNKSRVLTDLTGESYTLVHELNFDSLTAFEQESKQVMGSPDWRTWYDKFIPFVESGSRQLFNVIE